jgi:hypothetical protein
MALRWTAAASLEVEKRLHSIKGYKSLNLLVEALRTYPLDVKKEAV